MKLKSKLLSLASMALLALGFASFSTPASATVQTCTKWPATPGTSYPLNGYLYQCFPAFRNVNEQTLQSQMMNAANAGVARLSSSERNDLQSHNVQIRVFYNGTDAFDTLAIPAGTGSEPALKPTESGRSWIAPIYGLTVPTTTLFVFTQTQWTALNGAIPTTYNATQLGGTAHHELGHQMDRIWAQRLGYANFGTAPAVITLNATNKNYGKAVNVDGARLSAQDVTTLQTLYPKFLTSTGGLNFNEIFAEQFAMNTGGGSNGPTGADDTFLRSRFPCSLWYVTQTHSGTTATNTSPPTPPAAPGNNICLMPNSTTSYTSWSQIAAPY